MAGKSLPLGQPELWRKFESSLYNDGLTDSRIYKLRCMWRTLERHLSTDFMNVDKSTMESFIDDLHRDKIKSEKGKNFSGATKSDIKKSIRQIWKFIKGGNEEYPKEVSWIRGKIRKDEMPEEKPVVSLEELKKLASTFVTPEYRVLTFILFDSGFRIGEVLSVKKRHITWENFSNEQSCFWIECIASKTERRKIPIPLFTEELQAYINSFDYKQKGNDDSAFDVLYDNYRMALKRNSERVLKRNITPHCLRHSSATYYARQYEGNMVLLAQRYGWTYSSKQLQTYVRRSGAYQKEGAKKVYQNEALELRKENESLRSEYNTLQSEFKNLKEQMIAKDETAIKMMEQIEKLSRNMMQINKKLQV